ARGKRRAVGPHALHGLPGAGRAGGHVAIGRDHRRHRHRRAYQAGGSMNPVGVLHDYLVVGAILFALGLIGFLARRNFIIMFLSAETMLLGVSVCFVSFARFRGNLQGQVFVLFILAVAACEAAVALALLLLLYRG